MTIITAENTTQTAIEASGVGLGWVDDVLGGGACWSPEEAKAKTIGACRLAAPGWDRRSKSFLNRWKRVLWDQSTHQEILMACEDAGTSANTFKAFMMLLGGYTSWDGKDPVFVRRETIAAAMPGRSKVTGGAGLRVVDRCMAVAVELGFVTKGFQRKWLKANADGTSSWKAGAAARMLLLPSFGPKAHQLARETVRWRTLLRRDEAASAAMAAKKKQDAEHRARMDALDYPSTTPSERASKVSRSEAMATDLAAARRALE